jgi:hypothetical protein
MGVAFTVKAVLQYRYRLGRRSWINRLSAPEQRLRCGLGRLLEYLFGLIAKSEKAGASKSQDES